MPSYEISKEFLNLDIDELESHCIKAMASFYVTSLDFSKLKTSYKPSTLFCDIWSSNGYLLNTNVLFSGPMFKKIDNFYNRKEFKVFLRTVDFSSTCDEVKEYMMSDERAKESALFVLRMKYKTETSSDNVDEFYNFLRSKEGIKAYSIMFEFFKKHYSDNTGE